MKWISIALVLSALTVSPGCVLVDAFSRLANIPEHCSVTSGGNNWLDLTGRCSFDNPFDALR